MSIPLTPKLHWIDAEHTMLKFWCPGCQEIHIVYVGQRSDSLPHPIWTWNNNPESPTLNPSVRHSDQHGVTCHYFIRDGHFHYCGDCRHGLAGQVVAMVDIPGDWQ